MAKNKKATSKPEIPAVKSESTGGRSVAARERSPIKKFLALLGPGFIAGASDDDPSGIGTYAVTGAQFGFAPLWLAIVSFPLMTVTQYICGKIGMQCGMGLAAILRKYYSRWVLLPAVGALVLANTINVGADIGAVAAAINLLIPKLPILAMIVPVTIGILVFQIWASYRLIERIFKWLTLSLLAYIGSAFFAKPDWAAVLHGTFVPHLGFDGAFVTMVVAILGTTISPYLWFWQADQEVEEEISMGRTSLRSREGATKTELKMQAADTSIGMFFSQVVMYFIILSTAATLHATGQTQIESATDAAKALQPIAGSAASALLAIGLAGAGILAIPVLSGSASYAVAEAFGWDYGLDEKPSRAKAFYGIIAASTLVGMAMNFIGINPISALFWTAVINGVLAPPLLVLIMIVANNKKIMGRNANGTGINIGGWITVAVMFAATIAMLATWGS